NRKHPIIARGVPIHFVVAVEAANLTVHAIADDIFMRAAANQSVFVAYAHPESVAVVTCFIVLGVPVALYAKNVVRIRQAAACVCIIAWQVAIDAMADL